ncbi:IS3 family transposase [Actinotalea sp. K2]|uniref:IS3 family transposase n=1 Tax=Actinotalea sp. K2 TaxID=2939438 RepID=UPI0035A93857
MTTRLVQELAADGVPVALTCRVLGISRSGPYEARGRAPSARQVADQALISTIVAIHQGSRATYGAPRVHAELRLGLGVACGRKRVARLMRTAGLVGVCDRRKRRGQRPLPAPHEDLVQRGFTADGPDRLWCTDITEHPTNTGNVYCAAVLDVFTRRVVGWSIADHMRSELVVDALQMAIWRRQPAPGAIVHADRGSQGGLNRSSQHPVITEVSNGATTAAGGSGSATGDAVTGAADPGPACRAGVLAADRQGREQRGGRGSGRCVVAGRVTLVSSRWRDGAVAAGRADRPLPVVPRARGTRTAEGARARCPSDRP